MHIYTPIHIYTYTYTHMHTPIYMHIYIYLSLYTYIYIYIYRSSFKESCGTAGGGGPPRRERLRSRVGRSVIVIIMIVIGICIRICVYIYIYTCTYVYTHIISRTLNGRWRDDPDKPNSKQQVNQSYSNQQQNKHKQSVCYDPNMDVSWFEGGGLFSRAGRYSRPVLYQDFPYRTETLGGKTPLGLPLS